MELETMSLDTGRHMDADEVERYSMGRLSLEQAGKFEDHLLVCETCRDRLVESEHYVTAVRSAAAELDAQSRKTRVPFFFTAHLVPVFTLAALILLVSIWLARSPKLHSASPSVAVYLQALRGNGVSVAAQPNRPLALTLDLNGIAFQPPFRIEIVDANGGRVWGASINSGNASAPALHPGTYFVRLYAASGALLREYALEVTDNK